MSACDRQPAPNLALYERLKADWTDKHPQATAAEYSAAMRLFADVAGI